MVEGVCVDPKQVHLIWPQASHWIERAMERGDLGLFEVLERDVLRGDALLWLVWDEPKIEAAAVTQIVKTECTRSCVIAAYGGRNGLRWVDLIEKIEDYARAEKCDAVRVFGRPGWANVLTNYETTRIVLERRL